MTPTFFFFSLKNVLREIIKKKVNICIVNEGISRIKIYVGLFYEVQTEYWETKFFTMRGVSFLMKRTTDSYVPLPDSSIM
jgi:hypothetical protein